MNVVERVIAARKDVTSDWFAQRQRQETAAAARLLLSAFAVLVACVALASVVLSVVSAP